MIDNIMNEYGYRESGVDNTLMNNVLNKDNTIGTGKNTTSKTEGSWPFDQTNHSNGSTPMGTLDTMSFYKKEPTPPAPTGDYMYFEAAEANSTVSMMSTLTTAPDLEYSTDGETWWEWQHTTETEEEMNMHTFDTLTLTAVGDRVYLRGDNPNGLANEEGLSSIFILSGMFYSGGQLISLIDGNGEGTEIPSFGFFGLFNKIDLENEVFSPQPLRTLPKLDNIVSVGEYGLSGTFTNCQYAIEPVDMPSLVHTQHGSLNEMYTTCISLQRAADMPNIDVVELLTNEALGDWMYGMCNFTMSDDGESFNFDFPLDSSLGITPLQLADLFGNLTGFGYGSAFVVYDSSKFSNAFIAEGGSSSVFDLYIAPGEAVVPYYRKDIQFTNGEYTNTLTAEPEEGMTFNKWQKWNGSEWVDISTSNPASFTLLESERVGYYRAVAN